MFGKFGEMLGMLKNLPKLKAQMEEFQQRIGSIVAEANSGAGMVTAKVNGRMELVGVTISEEAMKLDDREMLEDLIVAAVNQAMVKVREQVAEETQKLTGGLGLPPGTNLPGMS